MRYGRGGGVPYIQVYTRGPLGGENPHDVGGVGTGAGVANLIDGDGIRLSLDTQDHKDNLHSVEAWALQNNVANILAWLCVLGDRNAAPDQGLVHVASADQVWHSIRPDQWVRELYVAARQQRGLNDSVLRTEGGWREKPGGKG